MSPDRAGARVCVLTPQGRGAVAVVRVWGPRALAVADAVVSPSARPFAGGVAAGKAPARTDGGGDRR